MNKNTLLAFLGGVVAGGFTALLLAPKNGEETRAIISDTIKNGVKTGLGDEKYDELVEKIQDLKQSVTSKFERKEA